jgi:hypothetical protein
VSTGTVCATVVYARPFFVFFGGAVFRGCGGHFDLVVHIRFKGKLSVYRMVGCDVQPDPAARMAEDVHSEEMFFETAQ